MQIEKQARILKIGLWSDADHVAPWQWRKGVRNRRYAVNIGNVKPVASGGYHGNIRSRVFHSPACRYYNCKNCTAAFSSKEAALSAGYALAGNVSLKSKQISQRVRNGT